MHYELHHVLRLY